MRTIEKRLPPFGNGPFASIFFEPQTGIYKRDDWPSNFYHYRLRNSHGPTHQYTVDFLDEHIAQATIGPMGLEYPPGFLEMVDAAEKALEELHEMFRRRGWFDFLERIPPKCK